MNLTALRAAVANEGYPLSNTTVIDDALNATYREVHGSERWKFLEKQDTSLVTVAGTPGYAIPMADWRSLDAVRIENANLQIYDNLDFVAEQDYRDLYHVDRSTAEPYCWTWQFNKIWFYPTPDQVYTVTIDYIIEPPDLASGTDVPVLPLPYHDILRWGAVEHFAYRQRDWLGRQFAEQKKATLLAEMKGEYQVKQRQTGSHVKRTGRYSNRSPWPYGVSWS